jgi:hypothetical protein
MQFTQPASQALDFVTLALARLRAASQLVLEALSPAMAHALADTQLKRPQVSGHPAGRSSLR